MQYKKERERARSYSSKYIEIGSYTHNILERKALQRLLQEA